jgi:nucleotide-binding universal stress UspA family protein
MYKKIILAYDGSKEGQRALLECKDIAQWSSSEIRLVGVIPYLYASVPIDVAIPVPKYEIELDFERKKSILNQGIQQLSNLGFNVDGDVLTGNVAQEIVNYSLKHRADLIVLGHQHQKGWALRWWGDNSSKAIIELSHCSVLIVISK